MGLVPVAALLAAAAMGPSAGASAHSGLLEQRRALAALPVPGASAERSYRRTLVHVDAALSALRAASSALMARARNGEPLPNLAAIQISLDQALGADNIAAALLTGTLEFYGRTPPPSDASVRGLRSVLRRGLTATIALAKLTDGL
jgi:hypothetical protein